MPTLPTLRAATPRRVAVGERILTSEMVQGLAVWRQFQLANALQGESAHEIAMAGDGSYVAEPGAADADHPAACPGPGGATAAAGRGPGGQPSKPGPLCRRGSSLPRSSGLQAGQGDHGSVVIPAGPHA